MDVQPVSSTNKSPSGHLAEYKQSYLSSGIGNLTLYGTKTIIWLSPINIVSSFIGVMMGSFKLWRKSQISLGWTWRFLKDSQGTLSEKHVTSKHLESQHSIRSYLIRTDTRNFLASIDILNDTNKIPGSHKVIVNSLARIEADDRTAQYVYLLDQCRVSKMTKTTWPFKSNVPGMCKMSIQKSKKRTTWNSVVEQDGLCLSYIYFI